MYIGPSRTLLGVALPLLCAACAIACARPREGTPTHPNLVRVWNVYERLPEARAMAIAGDPRRNQWVTGASGGHDTSDAAMASALAECHERRFLRRMRAECVLYAIGGEIVWQGP